MTKNLHDVQSFSFNILQGKRITAFNVSGKPSPDQLIRALRACGYPALEHEFAASGRPWVRVSDAAMAFDPRALEGELEMALASQLSTQVAKQHAVRRATP